MVGCYDDVTDSAPDGTRSDHASIHPNFIPFEVPIWYHQSEFTTGQTTTPSTHSTTMTDVAKDASFLDQTPILELHRNNLLNIEVSELLDEIRCNLTPSDANVGWATFARDYVAMVTTVIRQMPAGTTTIDPYPLSKTSMVVQVPTQLKVEPIGSFGSNSIGLTNQTGNANVLPTLDCVVMLPDSMWNPKDYLNHRYFDVSQSVLYSQS